jgi:hypothetical protein
MCDRFPSTSPPLSSAGTTLATSKAAMIIRAEAESEGADSVQEKRRYELQWEKMKLLETLASIRGRILISGSDYVNF